MENNNDNEINWDPIKILNNNEKDNVINAELVGRKKRKEQKKKKTLKISAILLLISIIVIIIMAICMFNMYKDKKDLQTKVDDLNKKIAVLTANLQILENEKNEIIEDVVENTTDEEKEKDTQLEFTNVEIQKALEDYLQIRGNATGAGHLQVLKNWGDLNIADDKSTYTFSEADGGYITDIKFEDYKSAMLKYMTEDLYNKDWPDNYGCCANSNGYLEILQGGGSYAAYTVLSIEKIDENNYVAKGYYLLDNLPEERTDVDITFSIKNIDGRCVLDTIENAI